PSTSTPRPRLSKWGHSATLISPWTPSMMPAKIANIRPRRAAASSTTAAQAVSVPATNRPCGPSDCSMGTVVARPGPELTVPRWRASHQALEPLLLVFGVRRVLQRWIDARALVQHRLAMREGVEAGAPVVAAHARLPDATK